MEKTILKNDLVYSRILLVKAYEKQVAFTVKANF